jgi:hypothetical protein
MNIKKSHQLCSFTGAKGKFICISNVNDVLNLRNVKWWYMGKTNTMKMNVIYEEFAMEERKRCTIFHMLKINFLYSFLLLSSYTN